MDIFVNFSETSFFISIFFNKEPLSYKDNSIHRLAKYCPRRWPRLFICYQKMFLKLTIYVHKGHELHQDAEKTTKKCTA